jgi:hypothetical protein
MKAYLNDLIQQSENPIQRRNLIREYLQARILGGLQRLGAMIPLAFHGGTALRFLYAIPRYSEGLDFTLEQESDEYDLRRYGSRIQKEMEAEGYAVEIKLNTRRVVHAAFVRFYGLLHELGLSPHQDEATAVKIEVDTHPPAGAGLDRTVVRRHETLQLQHHDRATLLAGKVHAVLQREYTKGRDLYDLLWYLSAPDWPAPNLTLLNNALVQTGWRGERLSETNWREALFERLQAVAWAQAVEDVRPFLEQPEGADLLGPETFAQLLID